MEAGSTMNKNDLLLYVITDCDNLQGEALLARTEAILASGATMLQYRDKHSKARQDAEALKNLCHKYNVPFIVNDDVDLALAARKTPPPQARAPSSALIRSSASPRKPSSRQKKPSAMVLIISASAPSSQASARIPASPAVMH